MKEWRRVKEGDREEVLRVLARHGVRTYEGFPLAGLSDDELRDVYATYAMMRFRQEQAAAKRRAAASEDPFRQTQVLP